jgi:nicotinamide phosphoribosyltransferase
MIDNNFILRSDSYKYTHHKQYPPNTRYIYSYLESRGGKWDSSIFFGLQYLLKRYFTGPVVSGKNWDCAVEHTRYIDQAQEVIEAHLGPGNFNRAGWEHILNVHGGYLPLQIRAVPEGTDVPTGNALMTIVNTDPAVPWLTNFCETLLCQLWYPITVATQSNRMRGIILRYLEETGDPSLIPFKLHDFGFRGVSSVETAGIGGMAHLVNFQGTDTMEAIMYARKYYGCEMAGYSIPATEHSTITSWGQSREVEAYRNLLTQFPTGTIACVSDSYNIYNACREMWGGELKSLVTERDGVLVVRPDSGVPHEMVRKVVQILDLKFGSSLNKKGYKVLHPSVQVIQGDGIDHDTLEPILRVQKEEGYSADNLAFGSGGGLLQKLNRDDLQMAIKNSAACTEQDGWYDVFKSPVDAAGKRSKRGRLKLTKQLRLDGSGERLMTVQEHQAGVDVMRTVFENGKLLVDEDLDTVRQRITAA